MNANHVNQECWNHQQKDWRHDSPFTKEQEIWIVKWIHLMTPTQLRRSFINQFLDPKKSHHPAPRPFAFTRLIQWFDVTWGVMGRLNDPETIITPENTENVKQYFTENPKRGIREGCSELDLSYTTISEFCTIICIGKDTNHVTNLRKRCEACLRIWWTFSGNSQIHVKSEHTLSCYIYLKYLN